MGYIKFDHSIPTIFDHHTHRMILYYFIITLERTLKHRSMIFLKPFLLVYTDFIYLIFLFLCYTTENIWFKTVIISLVLFHNFFSHLKVISKNPKYLSLINAQGFWKANEGDFTNGLTFLVENTVYLAEYHTRTRDVGFLGPSKCGGLEERTCMSYFVESTLFPSQTHENLRYDQIIILLNANCCNVTTILLFHK